MMASIFSMSGTAVFYQITDTGLIQQLEDQIINYLATKIENNTHQIQGIITKIHAYTNLMKKSATIEFVRSLLED